jgi:Tfp pilus assembly PilM family ATPase
MSALKWIAKSNTRTALAKSVTRRGWIGIDFGATSVKLAQLVCDGSGVRMASRWSFPHDGAARMSDAATASETLREQIAQLKPLRRLFLGSNCAAVLPMALTEYRWFEIPKGSAAEQSRMTGEELAAELGVEPSELAYDCWDCSLEENPAAEVVPMAVTAVPRKTAQNLGNDLLSAGFECQVLDGAVCALARAVQLAGFKAAEDSVVAIDLSHTLPMVVLVRNGRPLFARPLRGVGLQSLLEPLESNLQLNRDECQQLLQHFGLAPIGESPTLATAKTMQIVAHPLQDLLNEIKRTVDYICQHFRRCAPRHVCLTGGGAAIKNLPEHIGQRLQMPTTPWTLEGCPPNAGDALYALAAGLSALAWEANACS